jgi:drug/metabolite transporter (DMT)-like permease
MRGLRPIVGPMPAGSLSSLAALHASVALFGFAALFGPWLSLPPTIIVLGRTLVAAAFLAILAALARDGMRPRTGMLLNGPILAVHWVAFFTAIDRGGVAIGLLGYASFPLFVLVLERVMLGRRHGAIEAVTALLVATGLVVLVPRFSWHDRVVQGLAFGVVSAVTFAVLAVRNRRYAATFRPRTLALWQNTVAALVLVPIVAASAEPFAALAARDVALILVLGIVCTAIAHTLFIASLARVSAHTASVVAALEPVYGIALAAWLLGEVPTLRTLAGATLIVGAAIVASRRAIR